MSVYCEGQLRHCFFGTYSAVIALGFDDEASASDAMVTLGQGWRQGEKSRKALIWSGGGEDFEALKIRFAGFGLKILPCGAHKCRKQCAGEPIDSCAHSIDYGPRFALTIPTVAREQASLFA